MAVADYSLQVNVEAVDKASEVFDKISQNAGAFKKDLESAGASGKKSMESLGQSMQSVGNTMTATGKTMTATVTTPIVALGTAAVKTAADFDTQMSKVQAISGATGKDMDDLRAKAREMGAKTKFSATEAGQGFEYMAMAGWKTGDMLDGIEGIMNLAAASGEDLGTTSDIVTDALTAFGLSAKDSGHFADVLAAASSNANTNVAMMGETFKYAAPIAGSFGYSAEDTALAIGLMANSGIKASQAGTSLRTIMSELTGDVKISGKALGDVAIATANADGTMRPFKDILTDCREAFSKLTDEEKVSAAESLVGKNAMSGFLALMNAGEGDIQKLTTALEGCDGASKRMADTMNDNLEGQLTILKSQLQELAISFGEILIPAVRSVVSILQTVVDWFNKIPTPMKTVITHVLAVVAAVGPLLLVGGKLLSGIGKLLTMGPQISAALTTIKAAAAVLGGGLKALWAVMMANPIVLVIAAVAALVAGFVYLWNHCEGFRQFWVNLWDGVKKVVSDAWSAIKSTLSTVWGNIKAGASSTWDAIKTDIRTSMDNIKTAVSSGLTAVRNTASTLLGGVRNTFVNAFNGIKSHLSGVLSWLKGIFNFSWSLPQIKLPHFSITGSFSLNPPSVPHFSISWYKSAYDDAMIFQQPTVFGANGFGDGNGSEVVVGDRHLIDLIREAFSGQAMGGDTIIPVYIGQDRIDEIVVRANQRQALLSGGR